VGNFDDALRGLMPNYTYKCLACGRELTLNRPIADRDNPGVNCTCSGEIVRIPDAPVGKVIGGTPKFHK
jgi:putative FmdB family regulatory protein